MFTEVYDHLHPISLTVSSRSFSVHRGRGVKGKSVKKRDMRLEGMCGVVDMEITTSTPSPDTHTHTQTHTHPHTHPPTLTHTHTYTYTNPQAFLTGLPCYIISKERNNVRTLTQNVNDRMWPSVSQTLSTLSHIFFQLLMSFQSSECCSELALDWTECAIVLFHCSTLAPFAHK